LFVGLNFYNLQKNLFFSGFSNKIQINTYEIQTILEDFDASFLP